MARTAHRRNNKPRAWLVPLVAIAVLAALATNTSISNAQNEGMSEFGPIRQVFSPDTDPSVIKDYQADMLRGFAQHQFSAHWNPALTARNSGGSGQGDSLTLTWSVIPDGTNMPPQQSGEIPCASNLISTFNGIYGAGVWQAEIQDVLDQWSAKSGVTYVPALAPDPSGTPVDDGATWPNFRGVDGVRGDIRLGGCRIDGTPAAEPGQHFGLCIFPEHWRHEVRHGRRVLCQCSLVEPPQRDLS